MRRCLALPGALLGALLLPGCGDTPLATALSGAGPVAVAAAPIAGPALRVTGGPRPLTFALVQEQGDWRLWRAEGGAALATQGPRIIATAGLGPGLAATRIEGVDPLADPRALRADPATSRRSIDLRGAGDNPAGMRFGLALTCELTAAPQVGWLVVTERCTGLGLTFENRFVTEAATGQVRRSRQWIGDVVLEVEGP
ncbi:MULTISPECIES: YjbF family lipoprotein [Roseomonadaceae]|uniref:YjbF family lipoprotein n=1 Tax=Falsiroseomonas oleicola TaxID=2801474 RepID=A0ABS6H8I6_9PROT|nr:YjbF family lipoprotein [Roseomonas oleicola]MBU8544754.1 YjbF family lipoprotein [Roseomonas oleicola]